MARWTASAKWAAGPALDGQRGLPLSLRLSEGLGRSVLTDFAALRALELAPEPGDEDYSWKDPE